MHKKMQINKAKYAQKYAKKLICMQKNPNSGGGGTLDQDFH